MQPEGDFYGGRGAYGNGGGGKKQSSLPQPSRDINNISPSNVIGRLPRMAARTSECRRSSRPPTSSNPILRYRGREGIKTDAIESNALDGAPLRDLRINRARRNFFLEDKRRKIHTLSGGGKSTLNRLHRSARSFYEYSSHILGRDDETLFLHWPRWGIAPPRAPARTPRDVAQRSPTLTYIYIYIFASTNSVPR